MTRAPRHEALDGAARRRDLREADRLVVLEREENRRAVGRELRGQHVQVDRGRQDPRRAARRRHHGEAVQAVVDELVRAALDVGDPLRVGAPREATVPVGLVVGPLVGRELPRRGALPRLDRPDVPVVRPVGLGHALGDEGDRLAVRRPRREKLVVLARGEHLRRLRGHVEERQVIAELPQVAVAVGLELEAVDDDRLLRLLLFLPGVLVGDRPRDPDRPRRARDACRRATSRSPRPRPSRRSASRPRRRRAGGATPATLRCRRPGCSGRRDTGRPGSSAASTPSPCSSSGAPSPCRPSSSSRCRRSSCPPSRPACAPRRRPRRRRATAAGRTPTSSARRLRGRSCAGPSGRRDSRSQRAGADRSGHGACVVPPNYPPSLTVSAPAYCLPLTAY